MQFPGPLSRTQHIVGLALWIQVPLGPCCCLVVLDTPAGLVVAGLEYRLVSVTGHVGTTTSRAPRALAWPGPRSSWDSCPGGCGVEASTVAGRYCPGSR